MFCVQRLVFINLPAALTLGCVEIPGHEGGVSEGEVSGSCGDFGVILGHLCIHYGSPVTCWNVTCMRLGGWPAVHHTC